MSTTTILKVRGLERLSVAELRAFIHVSRLISIEPDWLACVVSFETGGSFSPSQPNMWAAADCKRRGVPYYGAIGILQFMPDTCASLLSLAPTRPNFEAAMRRFEAMTFIEQLGYARRYLATYATRIKSLDDCYLAVFYPAAIGRTDDYVVGRRDAPGFLGRVYQQNAGFDGKGGDAKDGIVTRGEICSTIRAVRDAAAGKRLVVSDATTAVSETLGNEDEATRINAEQVLASVYDTASRMVGEMVSRDMARSSKAPPDTERNS
jgi:hypothetical protein